MTDPHDETRISDESGWDDFDPVEKAVFALMLGIGMIVMVAAFVVLVPWHFVKSVALRDWSGVGKSLTAPFSFAGFLLLMAHPKTRQRLLDQHATDETPSDSPPSGR